MERDLSTLALIPHLDHEGFWRLLLGECEKDEPSKAASTGVRN